VEKEGVLRIAGVDVPVKHELCIRSAQNENRERSRNIQLSVCH
jgi:hypothetical protein